MRVYLKLPNEIEFGSQDLKCYGTQGTDTINLNCKVQPTLKRVVIEGAFQYQTGNPGTVQIVFDGFKNPLNNIETASFFLTTMTSSEYYLDILRANLTVNFFCKYPCQTCDASNPQFCNSCYFADKYELFFRADCLETCPLGFMNTTTSNCTACQSPCASCVDIVDKCTACIDGYRLKDSTCVEIVYWYFPFLIIASVQFVLITVSEICTKTKSRFKEAFTALVAIPELMSWICFLVLHVVRFGYTSTFIVGVLACVAYALINWTHMCFHRCSIKPNAEITYRNLVKKYYCTACLVRLISNVFTYKFSIILVSYFCLAKRFRGDYSDKSWRTFNRFHLLYLTVPVPIMLFVCSYHIYMYSIYNTASYVAIEVIVLTTIASTVVLIDAMSALKCWGSTAKLKDSSRYKVEGDYESEDDDPKKRLTRQKDQLEVMGGDEEPMNLRNQSAISADYESSIPAESRLSHTRSQLDENTRLQIQVLEELARQMREEKEQLRLEKERIERERQALYADQAAEERLIRAQQNNFIESEGDVQDIYSQSGTEIRNQPTASYSQLEGERRLEEERRELERQREIEERLRLRRDYKDIEGEEMEDYDPIATNNDLVDESQEIDVIDPIVLPLPAFGEVGSERHDRDSTVKWLRQATPRAGGDSVLGHNDLTESQVRIANNKSPVFELAELNSSRPGNPEDYLARSNASFSLTNAQHEKDKSEMFQMRSDAQMEEDSFEGRSNDDEAFWIKSDAIRSDITQLVSQHFSEDNIVPIEAARGVQSNQSLQASEKFFLAQEEPTKGETAGIKSNYEGSVEHYLQNDSVAFGDQEGSLHREGTPMHYFQEHEPFVGEADDFQRSLQASQDDRFFSQEPNIEQESTKKQLETPPLQSRQNELRSSVRLSQNFVNEPAEEASNKNLDNLRTREELLTQGLTVDERQDTESKQILSGEGLSKDGENAQQQQEPFNDRNVMDDGSGHSESSEGIVDHNPFTSADYIAKVEHKAVKKVTIAAKQLSEKPKVDAQSKAEDKLVARQQTTKKQILYSDKSESSVEEMMGVTPSDYNVLNGRLDGKSAGLKTWFGTGVRPELGPTAAQHTEDVKGIQRSNETEERKFVSNLRQGYGNGASAIDRSADEGRDNLNQPVGKGKVSDMESRGDERSQGKPKKQKAIKTNKTFAESNRHQSLPPPDSRQKTIPRKNNYL